MSTPFRVHMIAMALWEVQRQANARLFLEKWALLSDGA